MSLEQTYPPYTVVQPRQLQRWLDVNSQNGPLSRTHSFITLPTFTQTVTWRGYSEIVATFNYEGPNNFSFKTVPTVVSPNYILCVMWTENGVTHRYSFWRDVGEVMYFDAPLYTGQLIKKNFRFEVWSINSTPAVQTSELTFYTSVLGTVDYRFGDDFKLVDNGTINTNFQSIKLIPDLPSNQKFNIDSGVALLKNILNNLVSWTDSVTNAVVTGDAGVLPFFGLNLIHVSEVVIPVSIGTTITLKPNTLAFTFCPFAFSTTTGSIINFVGADLEFTYNASTHSILCNGSTGVPVIEDRWYLVISLPSRFWVYDILTGVEIASPSIATSYVSTATSITIGGAGLFGITNVVTYEDMIYPFESIKGHYMLKLSNSLSLPLTFPSTSVLTTN